MAEPGCFRSKRDRDHGRDHIAADRLALLIDQEHAVGVAVERDAEIALIVENALSADPRMFSGSIGFAG